VEQRPTAAWKAAFIVLLILEWAPIGLLHHFPSQDGPSHLYNAAVMANRTSQPVYREYYVVRPTPAGNLLFQVLLAGAIRLVPAHLIEPLLLTTYLIVFALAFLSLLQAVTPQYWPFSLFAFLFAASNFFQTGFWNFMFSIPLALLALRYYVRGKARPSVVWYAVLTLWGLAIYEMHMASWMVFAIAIAIFSAADLLERPRGRSWMPLMTLLPPLALTLAFVAGSGYRSVRSDRLPETLASRATPLAALSFFRSLSNADLFFTGAFALLVLGMFAMALRRRSRAENRWLRFQPADAWLAVAIGCAAASVLAPSAASGVFIRHRLAFYAWLFLVVWLSTQPWRAAWLRVCGAAVFLLAALPFLWRVPEYRRWDRDIDEFMTAGPNLPSGSTVLALDMQDTWHRVNPLLHAVDLFAPKPFVDLRNYEAATAYFPTQFRPELNPFLSLGTLDELQHIPPVFHLAQYEERTHTSVEYLLFYGRSAEAFPERGLYAKDLSRYRLIFVSEPDHIARLYAAIR